MKTESIYIEGMACQHCVASVTAGLESCNGVNAVRVSLEEKLAEVTYDTDLVSRDALISVIEDLGFDAR